jgi:hypothetical protein
MDVNKHHRDARTKRGRTWNFAMSLAPIDLRRIESCKLILRTFIATSTPLVLLVYSSSKLSSEMAAPARLARALRDLMQS